MKKEETQETPKNKMKVTLKFKDEQNNVIESSKEIEKKELLPLNLGVVTLLSFGKVDLRKNFHNERYIYPVGYKSERYYNSYVNPSEKVKYTCEICADENSDFPIFKVTPSDDPDQSFTSNTATGAWTPIIKKVQESRKKIGGKRQYSTVSGPEYFGLSHPKCRELLSKLENAEKCESYTVPITEDVMDVEEEVNEKDDDADEFVPPVEPEEEEAEVEEEIETPKSRKSKRKAISRIEQMEETKTPKKSKQTKTYPGITPDVPLKVLQPHQYRYLTQGLEVFDGYEPFATMYKKEAVDTIQTFQPFYQYAPLNNIIQPNRLIPTQNFTSNIINTNSTSTTIPKPPQQLNLQNQQQPQQLNVQVIQQQPQQLQKPLNGVQSTVPINGQPFITQNVVPQPNIVKQATKVDFEKEVKLLRSSWEFAFVCHALALLRPILKVAEFTPLELERAIILPNEHNGVLADIHVRLIKGPAIDRKAYECLQPGSLAWIRITQNKLDTVESNYWSSNPLRKDKYANISPIFRVLILKSILDWKIVNNQKCSDYLHNMDEMLRFDPLGYDKDDNIYWYFGEEVGRLYKETAITEKKTNVDEEYKKSNWSICCDSIEEFKSFMNKLETSLNDNESKLFAALKYVFPILEAYKNEAQQRAKQREEQKILEEKRREEENRKREERKIKQKLYQEQRKKEMEDYQKQLMMQMSSSFTATTRSSMNTPEKKEEAEGEDEEFEGRTRSGRAIRRRILIEDEIEEKPEGEETKDTEALSTVQKKRAKDDEEFKLQEDDEDEDDDDLISDDDILTEEEEEPFVSEEDDFESDEEYASPKRNTKSQSKKSQPQSKNQKNFFIPSTTTYKPLAPIMTSFKQQPLPQIPLSNNTQQPLMNSPSFQAYYQNYLKLLMEQQKKSGITPTVGGQPKNLQTNNNTVYQPNFMVPQKNITPSQQSVKSIPQPPAQQSKQQPIQRIKISQNTEKESALNQDNFFNMIPESDFTTEEMDTIDSVLSNQRDLLE